MAVVTEVAAGNCGSRNSGITSCSTKGSRSRAVVPVVVGVHQ